MNEPLPVITIEHLLQKNDPEGIRSHRGIAIVQCVDKLTLFSQPARLNASTIFVCNRGHIECDINLKKYSIEADSMLVILSDDIIRVHHSEDVLAYAIILSEEYMQTLLLDFRLRSEIINTRGIGPLHIDNDNMDSLNAYRELLIKNIRENNSNVINGLAQALSYTVLNLLKRHQSKVLINTGTVSRAQQLFDHFMHLLYSYHTSQRSIKFYADHMCLTGKYLSRMVRSYSGRSAVDWINEYVMLEIRMMLHYTTKTVKEIAYSLNFPSQSAFGKYFKQQTGMNPKQYRQSQQTKLI